MKPLPAERRALTTVERARLPKLRAKVDRVTSICKGARLRAAQLGLPFDLEPAALVFPSVCPVLGIAMSFDLPPEHRPTLDRVVPALGYVKSNVRIISMRANRIKSDASADELARIMAYIVQNTGH